jgi:hypothetical protein
MQGCQIFLGTTYQTGEKCTKLPQNKQMSINYTKGPFNIPNFHKIYQHLALQDPPKFMQIWILGLKNMPSGNRGHMARFKFLAPT